MFVCSTPYIHHLAVFKVDVKKEERRAVSLREILCGPQTNCSSNPSKDLTGVLTSSFMVEYEYLCHLGDSGLVEHQPVTITTQGSP